ncbi:hypothetical protein D030_1409A, partial [Vibrio parahaemolyticus AQ3810]
MPRVFSPISFSLRAANVA